jgi:hypothetical protein
MWAAAVCAAVLELATTGVGAAGAHPERPNPSENCALVTEQELETLLGTDITHGACLAFVAGDNPVPLFVSACQSPGSIASLEDFYGVDVPEDNIGQCVNFLRDFFGEGAV